MSWLLWSAPLPRGAGRRGWARLMPPAVSRQWEAGRHGRQHVLAEQTQGPPSTLAPLCTQGVRPDSPGLHFMVTKTTKRPSRNCQQHGRTRVFGSIFAESDKPYPLWHIDLDPPLTRKSGGPSPACLPAWAFSESVAFSRKLGARGFGDSALLCFPAVCVVTVTFSLYLGREPGLSRSPVAPCECRGGSWEPEA